MARISLLRFFMIILALMLSFAALMTARAQDGNPMEADADKTWFLSFVESKLSGPNRQIRISNIDGVLSSRASIGLITVADREGVWLRINDVKLDWNRLALLAGRISINSLSAQRIEVLRKPLPEVSAPAPEAGGFALPALPVAVMIDSLKARQVLFSQQLFGVASVVSLEGHLNLAGGALDSGFNIKRLDGPGGEFRLVAGYATDTQNLDIDLRLSEPANGIAANLLKIENRPPLHLSLKGDGPLDNLNVSLKMDAANRPALDGLFTLRAANGGRTFNLVMNGPVASLVPEIYRPFFGSTTRLNADGMVKAAGGMRLNRLSLEGSAVHVSGQAETAPDGFLRQLFIDAHIAAAGGGSLVLPVSGGKTAAGDVRLNLAYGQPGTDSWSGKLAVHNLVTKDLRAGDLTLDMGGPAENLDDPANRHVGVAIRGGLNAITSPHPEVVRAMGSHIGVNVDVDWRAGAPVAIKTLDVNAERLALFIKGTVENLVFRGSAGVKADNLAPFSGLAGQPLAGRADLQLHGAAGLVDGTFDVNLAGAASGLRTGNDAADRLLVGDVTLSGGIGRDGSGIRARSLRIGGQAAELTADGHFASETADMNFGLRLSDMALIDPRVQGPLVLKGAARGHNSLIAIGLRGSVANGTWGGRRLANAAISFNGVLDRTTPLARYVSGMVRGSGSFGGERLALSATFHTDTDQAALDGLDVAVGNAKLGASLVKGANGLVQGKLHVDAADISTLAALAFTHGKGAAYLDASLDGQSGKQNATVNASISKLDVAGIRVGALRMQAAFYDLLGVPQADGAVEGSAIHAAHHDISFVRASSKLQNQSSHFAAEAGFEEGASVAAAGVFSPLDTDGWQLSLESARLHYQGVSSALLHPSKVLFHKNGHIGISNLAMTVGDGSLAVDGALADKVSLVIDMKSLPLSLANLVRPNLGLDGVVSGIANITGSRDRPDLDFNIDASGLAARSLRESGIAPLDLKARGKTTDQVLDLDASLSGGGLNVGAQGRVFLAQQKLDLDVTLKDTPLTILSGIVKDQNLSGVVNGSAHVSGAFSNPAVKFSVQGDNLAAKMLADNGFAPVRLAAAGAYADKALDLDKLDLEGPQDLNMKASGRLPLSGHGLDFRVDGSVPLSLANRFLADRGSQLSGRLTVNAKIGGSFQEPRFDGNFAVANGQFIDPELNMRLNAITLSGRLDGEQIVFDHATATSASGGSLSLAGWVSANITQGLPGNLTLDLNHARYNDGSMLVATMHGKMHVTGPLMRDPTIAGDITIEKAEINVPDNFGGVALIDVRHRHLTPPIAKTLARAGLEDSPARTPAEPARLLVAKLDVQIKAPNRIFVRGRGLDVELRGQLRLAGPVTDIHPIGGFNMVRGRFDILAQRLTFREGQVTMTGNMNPELNFVAVSEGNDITVTVNVSGTPQDLKVTFTSQPPLPQDEVLARLIFKRSLGELSPFQVAQLVDATAELAGITSRSVLGSLRAGTGLDKLDIVTDALGNAGVEAGRYIQDKLYLGVETAVGGASKGTVNLDINRNLKAKGSVSSDSTSSVGIFYEKDY